MSKRFLQCLACASILSSGAMFYPAAPAHAMDEKAAQKAVASKNVRESIGMSIRDAVVTGVKTNPEYNGIAASRRATDEELRQGYALYYPSLDAAFDTGYEYTNDTTTRAIAGDDEELWRSQSSLTLTQMLFDGFETKYEVQRQKARVVSSAHRVHETTELVALSIIEAYLNVLRQRYLSAISQENVDDHKEILDQISSGVDAGRSTQADLEQARARLASAQAAQANVLEALETAESQYYREVGAEPGALIMPTVPYSNLRTTLEDEITYALAASPTLKVFESDIEVAYAEAEGTKSTYYPQVDFQVSGSYADHIGGIETYEKNASALVVANWNLYRGGADVAREREFRYRHEQAKAQYSEAARGLEDEVRRTWAAMIAAGTRAEKYAGQADANEEVVAAYKDQFTLNRRTLLDVLDAQNELFVSKTNKINAEFVQMFSVYRLIALRGEVLDILGVPPIDETVTETASAEWEQRNKMKAR